MLMMSWQRAGRLVASRFTSQTCQIACKLNVGQASQAPWALPVSTRCFAARNCWASAPDARAALARGVQQSSWSRLPPARLQCWVPQQARGYSGQTRWLQQSWQVQRFGGRRLDPDRVVWGLLGTNAAVFLAWQVCDPGFMYRHFTCSLDAVRHGRLHTLITSAFSQRETMHLLANMFTLYFFGRSIAYSLGGRVLLQLYLLGGLAASSAQLAYAYWQVREYAGANPRVREYAIRSSPPCLGASGSVSAVVIFGCIAAPSVPVYLYGVLPIPAWLLGLLYIGADVSGALGHPMGGGRGNIGYAAHLGGATTGALYWAYMRGLLKRRGGRF